MINRRPSLFRHTAFTVAFGLIIFQMIATVALFINLVFPLAQRSAGDLASLIVWSARTWSTTAPEQRRTFESELQSYHGLTLFEPATPLADQTSFYPYINFLRTALSQRLSPNEKLRLSETRHEHFQVEFITAGHRLRFSFSKNVIPPTPSFALAWTIAAGLISTLIIAWLIAKRITAPIKRFAEAARYIGQGKQPAKLPETGEAELAELAHIFNETALQLRARQDNQSTLLAGVSHDLRSPLARMKMALGLLAEESTSPLIKRLEQDVDEMDMLIGAQMELARAQEPECGQLTDIAALITDIAETLAAQAPGRLLLRLPQAGCTANIATLALRRCLVNLTHNALRYSENSVEIICRHYSNTFFIGVRDRGSGIPKQLTDKVFRPFYRIESSRNRATGGSGLGLSITRQLAETHGWRVNIKHRIGGGVSAWLAIPDLKQ